MFNARKKSRQKKLQPLPQWREVIEPKPSLSLTKKMFKKCTKLKRKMLHATKKVKPGAKNAVTVMAHAEIEIGSLDEITCCLPDKVSLWAGETQPKTVEEALFRLMERSDRTTIELMSGDFEQPNTIF